MADSLPTIKNAERITHTAASANVARLMEQGKRARKSIPRTTHAAFTPVDRDPVEFLNAQNESRLPELIELRHERMSADPFAFFRGTAGLMAIDLQAQLDTKVHLVICGDAHIANFGIYASPERKLVFDLNDFDEAAAGPWEWDVKRLVTSVVVGGQQLGLPENLVRKAAEQAAKAYRQGLIRLFSMTVLERFYYRVDEEYIQNSLDKETLSLFNSAAKKATRKTGDRFLEKSMEVDESGRLVFIETPPVLTHLPAGNEAELIQLAELYRGTVRPDIGLLLSTHTLTDVARRVVGVGSVGTRCFVLAMTGPDDARLVLQVKEAQPSVVSTYSTPNDSTPKIVPSDAPEGQRVVAHQQVLQAVSDPFLGHFQANGHDFYVRQFRDMKGSIDLTSMSPKQLAGYAAKCGLLLARAHSQSPASPWVAGYLGNADIFDKAVVSWAFEYSKQSMQDYLQFKDSLKTV